MTRIAILAGGGQLPLAIADSISAGGGVAHIVAIDGAANAEFGRHPTTRVGLGKLNAMLTALRQNGDAMVIAGHLTRPDLLRLKPDRGFFRHLPDILALLSGGDDAVLTRVVRFFENRGLRVLGIGDVAPDLIVADGLAAGPELQSWQPAAERGFEVLDAVSDLDIGQAIVVTEANVLAFEGVEGTDRMLARLGTPDVSEQPVTSRVLVKAPKRGQELRIDMPTIGPQTIVRAAEAGLTAIVVEAGRTVVVDLDQVREIARERGIAVFGARRDGADAAAVLSEPVVASARRGVQAGRVTPLDYDRADAMKAIACCERLSAFGAGKAACVVRQHVLAVEAGEGIVAMASRLAALRQWGGL
ncbi:MAG TPA: UDP-2,3-diacylglucosamine diphosphatase LpxI, partial [Hyphomicrobiaceae bacterium]|nr:UDP-2,3-diacylglucosamine diphosphatase LpxI [Hyphomicrobiaceae bacterium]